MNRVRAFLLAAARLGCGLALADCVVAVGGWGVSEFIDYRRLQGERPLAELKRWPTETLEPLGDLKFEVATIWQSGRIRYKVDAAGFPPAVATASMSEPEATFVLIFEDRHGFKLFERRILVSEMTGLAAPKGQVGLRGLRWQGDDSIDADQYRAAVKLAVAWSGFSETRPTKAIPEPSPTPTPTLEATSGGRPQWRQLRRGLSKAEVRELLGEPSKGSGDVIRNLVALRQSIHGGKGRFLS